MARDDNRIPTATKALRQHRSTQDAGHERQHCPLFHTKHCCAKQKYSKLQQIVQTSTGHNILTST